jgi:hypothetical protein
MVTRPKQTDAQEAKNGTAINRETDILMNPLKGEKDQSNRA